MELKSKTLPNSLSHSLQTRRCHAVLHLASRRQQGDAFNSHSFKRVFTILLGLFGCFIRNCKDRRKGVAAAGAHPCPPSTSPPAHTCTRHVIHLRTRSSRPPPGFAASGRQGRRQADQGSGLSRRHRKVGRRPGSRHQIRAVEIAVEYQVPVHTAEPQIIVSRRSNGGVTQNTIVSKIQFIYFSSWVQGCSFAPYVALHFPVPFPNYRSHSICAIWEKEGRSFGS